MPVVSRSNNRILPANSRAADVAAKTIRELTDVQQRRHYSAFVPQGIAGILYSRLEQGMKCTCQSAQAHLGHRLGLDGKAPEGALQSLMMGIPVSAGDYGEDDIDPLTDVTSPFAPANKHQGVFDTHANDNDDVFSMRTVPLDGFENPETFLDDGPQSAQDIDELVGDFDPGLAGYSDAACPVCFGSGYVGGYAPMHAYRVVAPCNSPLVELGADSEIDASTRPWRAVSERIRIVTVLPRGVVGIDCCRIMNGRKSVGVAFTVNGVPLTAMSLLAACNGGAAVIEARFDVPTQWTHFELQLVQTGQSMLFELPRLPRSSDLSKLDTTTPFQVTISPNVQIVREQDVIVESMFGRPLFVSSVNPWNTRDRNVLGHEVEVRVAQPEEIFTILPRRGHVLTTPPTTTMVRDNASPSNRRT